MNALLVEITKSLKDIHLALNGELTATDQMEAVIDSLVLERVPAPWMNLAYPSARGLSSWLTNLVARFEQLNNWKDEPSNMPKCVNIARLFNPQSYLTAIQQYMSQRNQWELNKLYIITDVTKRTEADLDGPAREGAYVSGINLDGARWDIANNMLEESKPKEMFCPMPVVNCKAALINADAKEDKNVYLCPVYKTVERGPTYVFTA
jgi:dynein heavy chain